MLYEDQASRSSHITGQSRGHVNLNRSVCCLFSTLTCLWQEQQPLQRSKAGKSKAWKAEAQNGNTPSFVLRVSFTECTTSRAAYFVSGSSAAAESPQLRELWSRTTRPWACGGNTTSGLDPFVVCVFMFDESCIPGEKDGRVVLAHSPGTHAWGHVTSDMWSFAGFILAKNLSTHNDITIHDLLHMLIMSTCWRISFSIFLKMFLILELSRSRQQDETKSGLELVFISQASRWNSGAIRVSPCQSQQADC
jgi:hypothetical protein